MKKPVVLASLLLTVSFSGMGLADDAGLRRCRGIAESAERLACYDALVLPGAAGVPAPTARASGPLRTEAPSAIVEGFGMEAKTSQPDRIESHIPGRFEGWQANSLIRLANGQVWKVVDGSGLHGQWDNPKVAIRRGMLGSFYLDIEGENRSGRVRRVQ